MGGSSKKGAPAQMGPATAGGPTPTLTQAQPFYPSYPSYSPQSAPNPTIGLTIPSDVNSLRQTAMAQQTGMLQPRPLVNRAPFIPRTSTSSSMVRQFVMPSSQTTGQSPAQMQISNYTPSLRYIAVNPEPPKPVEPKTPDNWAAGYNAQEGTLMPGWIMGDNGPVYIGDGGGR